MFSTDPVFVWDFMTEAVQNSNTNGQEKDYFSVKLPVFDGEKFDYWKDRI